MLALETKQSGGKLLPHSELRGGVFLGETSRNIQSSSPNIVRVIKSRRMRWAGHVARIVEERGCIESWWGNQREGAHWGDLGVDGG